MYIACCLVPLAFSVSAHAAPGVWVNATPSNVDLSGGGNGFPGCGNFGTTTVAVDPAHPSDLYAEFNCQGIWKSTDFGQTWNGPINTGPGGATAGNCAGGITLALGPAGQPPILYETCIRGLGLGFWRSTDGGVSWTNFQVTPTPGRQDYYAPAVDPYDSNHLIMAGHEMDALVQSTDGGTTWTSISLDPGMDENGGTGFITFINTGNAGTTRITWLWMGQQTGGTIGTWRTTNGGTSWTQVDTGEHPHGESQIYQPDNNGVVFMAQVYSALGWGVLRSTDYGQTWNHVGGTGTQGIVYGTPNNVYSDWSWACGGCTVDPGFQFAPLPGTGTWSSIATPAGMAMGPAQVATTFDGSNYILVGANWLSGLWRYVEPASGAIPSPACDLNGDGSTNVSDVQLCVNQAIGVQSCTSGDINKDGNCNVIDVQRDVNAALGGNCVTQ